jgi:hypothetical protein
MEMAPQVLAHPGTRPTALTERREPWTTPLYTATCSRATSSRTSQPTAARSVAPDFKLNYPNIVFALDVSGSRLYVGTGDPLEGVEALDPATGKAYWSVGSGHPDVAAGDVQAVAASGTKVYAGGHFAQMGNLKLDRKRLVELDAATGEIGPWAPAVAGGNLGVWALETDPGRKRLYAGGDFTKIGGIEYQRFAQFSGL